MDVEPAIQTLPSNGVQKEEEFDQLVPDDPDDWSDFEDDDDDADEFRIRDPLPQFREYKSRLSDVHGESFSVSFYTALIYCLGMVHSGGIDLNPPYQRGLYARALFNSVVNTLFLEVVWPEEKQSQLIESIFRNYTVPQVVFAVRRDEDGEECRICVDGKQVCLAVNRFATELCIQKCDLL